MGIDGPERLGPGSRRFLEECHSSPERDASVDGDLRLLHRRLTRVTRAFLMLAGCTQVMLRASDEHTLLQRICCIITKSGGYSLAWVGYAQCDQAQTVRPVAQAGQGEEYVKDIRVSWGDNDLGQGPTGIAIRTGEPCVTRHIPEDASYKPWQQAASKFGHRSSIAIPLYCEGAVLGALNVYSMEPDSFDAEEVALLEELAGNMSYGIASIRTRLERQVAEEELRLSWDRLRRTLQGTVKAMTAVTEIRDPYTAGHQQRVSELADAIGRELRLSKDQVEGIRVAGLLHDVGKVYIPSQILNKPGLLTPVEYNLVKVHSEAGYSILKNVDFPWPVAEIVMQHHEREDGSGYPDGLAGRDTMLPAKIIAVSDTVEAMSNFRPYRPAQGIDKALEEIQDQAGAHYDPVIVDACVRLFKEGRFGFSKS